MAAAACAPPARLFVAVWPDPSAHAELLAWRSRLLWPSSAAPTLPEHLHLTLHFIGAVPAARLGEIESALALPFDPFVLDFDGAALWPGGLAVLTASAPPPALAALHGRLAGAIGGLGLPVEQRPYRPHVTLARHAAGAVPPADPPRLSWRADGYALVRSDAGYRTLARWPGAGQAGTSP